MKLSISDISLYMRCPRAYKLHKIDGVEPKFKSISLCKAVATKKAIHRLHTQKASLLDYMEEEIGYCCESAWLEEIAVENINFEDLESIVVKEKAATKTKPATPAISKNQKMLNDIKTWVHNYVKRELSSRVLYSNIPFSCSIADVEFYGHIDVIREIYDGDIDILSFSTSSSVPNTSFLERDFQMSLLAYSIWHGKLHTNEGFIELKTIPFTYLYYFPYLEQYKRKTGKYKQGDFKGNPEIAVPQNKEKLLHFEYEILYAVMGIKQNYFPMKVCKAAGCNICQYAYQCNNGFFNEQEVNPIPAREEVTV